MSKSEASYLTPEARARVEIDRMLEAAGWAVQDARAVNLAASRGVAVREFVMKPPHGRADYLLFVDGRAVGVIEAKKEGETLTGVEWQSAKYVDGLPDELEPAVEGGARRSSTSRPATETRFTNRLDPEPASRAGVLVPPARDAGRLARRAPPPPDGADAAPPAARAARARARRGCGRRSSRAITQPRAVARGEPAAGADPDGDRLGQDVHRRQRLPTGWSSTPTRGGSCSSSTAPTSAARR